MYKIIKVIKRFKKLLQRIGILEDFFMIIIIYYNNNNNNNNFILLLLLLLLLIIIVIKCNNFLIKNMFTFFMFQNVLECFGFWVLSPGVDKTWNMKHSGTFWNMKK